MRPGSMTRFQAGLCGEVPRYGLGSDPAEALTGEKLEIAVKSALEAKQAELQSRIDAAIGSLPPDPSVIPSAISGARFSYVKDSDGTWRLKARARSRRDYDALASRASVRDHVSDNRPWSESSGGAIVYGDTGSIPSVVPVEILGKRIDANVSVSSQNRVVVHTSVPTIVEQLATAFKVTLKVTEASTSALLQATDISFEEIRKWVMWGGVAAGAIVGIMFLNFAFGRE